MLFSRCTNILKTTNVLRQTKNAAINLQSLRHGHELSYRTTPAPNRRAIILSECVGGLLWWWFLWSLYHDYSIILEAHIPGVYPEHYTDEELGIPPEE